MEIEKEKLLKEYFSTKKELVYRVWLIDNAANILIRLYYKQCDVTTYTSSNNVNHTDFKFTNKSVALKAYESILDILNASHNDNFINFVSIINEIKQIHNDTINDDTNELVYYNSNSAS